MWDQFSGYRKQVFGLEGTYAAPLGLFYLTENMLCALWEVHILGVDEIKGFYGK